MGDACLISRVDSSGTTWPSSLIVNLDPAGTIPGGLLVEDKDKEPSMLERLSVVSLLLDLFSPAPTSIHPSVS